jgi:UrcA family protein
MAMTTSIKIQSKSIASIIAASFALLGWVAAAGSAQAAEPIEAPTKVVNYGDLNLDTAAGAHTMYARL